MEKIEIFTITFRKIQKVCSICPIFEIFLEKMDFSGTDNVDIFAKLIHFLINRFKILNFLTFRWTAAPDHLQGGGDSLKAAGAYPEKILAMPLWTKNVWIFCICLEYVH